MDKFILNGKEFLVNDVLNHDLNQSLYSSFEFYTLNVIRNWFGGNEHYSFKTSGSTGEPKTIKFTSSQIIKSARRTIQAFDLKPGDSVLCCLNTEFVAGFMMLVRALEGDLKLIIVEPSSDPLNSVDDQMIDFIAMTPNQVSQSMKKNIRKFRQIRKLLIGGAAIHPALEHNIQSLKCEVFHSYAMTETLTHVALRNISCKELKYTGLSGVSFGQNKNGCLEINDTLLNIQGLQTNDLVKLDNGQTFEWIGRIDHIINTGGLKVRIEVVESEIQMLLERNGIYSPFCVLSKQDEKLTHRIILLIEDRENNLDRLGILKMLKSLLPKYHDPKDVFLVPKIYYTATGKIDRIKNTSDYLQILS